jgi:hypothetical protein
LNFFLVWWQHCLACITTSLKIKTANTLKKYTINHRFNPYIWNSRKLSETHRY